MYSDEELKPWFEQVSKGYCFKQACKIIGYSWPTLEGQLNSDREVCGYALDLAMVAGALIRKGELPVPARYDGLYDKYKNPENWEKY